MTRAIIVGGEPVYCDADVRTWDDTGLGFPTLRTRSTTRAVILHHTGGEGDAVQCHATLLKRGLSVHFFVGADGTIAQYADANARCAHAREANAWSVGIEMQNRADDRKIVRGIERELVVENIHGQDATRTTFLQPQVTAALALTDALCRAYDLPFAVPMAGSRIYATALPASELATYRGVLGHLHLTRAKVDPGIAILRAVHASRNTRGKDGAAE